MSFMKCLLTFTLAAAPMLAVAGGTAVIQGDDKKMTLEFNGPLARVQVERKNIQIIARDDKLYAVTNMGGSPLVVESTAIMGVLGSQGLSDLQHSNDVMAKFVSLEPTGAKETVAGYAGAIYTLIYTDGNGKRRAQDTVLGAQPEVVELSQSIGHVASRFLQLANNDTGGAAQLVNELQKRRLGILRFGDKVRLISLDTATPAADRFVLPAAPTQIPPGLQGLLKGLGQK